MNPLLKEDHPNTVILQLDVSFMYMFFFHNQNQEKNVHNFWSWNIKNIQNQQCTPTCIQTNKLS